MARTPDDATRLPADAPWVLVVDDERSVRELVRTALTANGFHVVAVGSAERAVQVISHGDVDLVVLDARLPGTSGVDVLRRVRASRRTQALPVVMLSGDAEVARRIDALDLGATDYVVKPFDIDELVARVRSHLRARDVWQHQLQERLDERAMIARVLRATADQSTAEERGAAMCETLARVPGIDGAAVIWLTPGGAAVPIARAGEALRLPLEVPLPEGVGKYFAVRAVLGPWLERGWVMFIGSRPEDELSAGALACAPIGAGSQPDALLVLAPSPDATPGELAHVLAAAVDYAAVATGLLGRVLHALAEERSGRVDVEAVILDRRFRPWFQPVVSLGSHEVVGYEALTRFSDGTPPDRRFAQAARLGVGLDLEAATITAALDAAASHLPAAPWLSVNLSPSMLRAPDLLTRCLADARREVVLELTEHDPVEDYDALRVALESLPRRYRMSVDDAGAGFASLRHILRLRPDFIKLDRSWVHTIETDAARQALVAGLLHFASSTGATLIAEGIETPAEQAVLVDLGVPLGQGYLLGPPAPVGTAGGARLAGDDAIS